MTKLKTLANIDYYLRSFMSTVHRDKNNVIVYAIVHKRMLIDLKSYVDTTEHMVLDALGSLSIDSCYSTF